MNKFLLLLIIFFSLLILQKNSIIERELNDEIKTLVRQASRWSTAAKQDKNPMIAVLHANYGAGYLWALKDIATQNQIEKAAGIELLKFEKEITSIQDQVTKRMIGICPEFGPEESYLTTLGGEGYISTAQAKY